MKSSKQPSKSVSNSASPTEATKSATTLSIINYILVGIVLGLLIFAVLRFATYQPPKHTHYHANFEVFVSGQQQKFEDPSFYEEVASCTKYEDASDPMHRAHMHDNVFNVVHVHADGVTWGQFFENINSAAQPGFLRIHNAQYLNNDSTKVTYILNGKVLESLNGIVIGDQDKLLINYGNESAEVLQQRYDAMQNNAKHYDETKDPASCSGDHPATLQDRLNHILF